MVCINCGSPTRVNNSRLQQRINQVWRRRECLGCHTIFTTHEITAFDTSVVVRPAKGELEPFSRDKLYISVYESCKHRPEAVTNAHYLTQTIISALQRSIQDSLVDRDAIVEAAEMVLGRFDKTAKTVYQAYHPLPLRNATIN